MTPPTGLQRQTVTEYTGGSFNTSAGLNFSTAIGQYDANGNMINVEYDGLEGRHQHDDRSAIL